MKDGALRTLRSEDPIAIPTYCGTEYIEDDQNRLLACLFSVKDFSVNTKLDQDKDTVPVM